MKVNGKLNKQLEEMMRKANRALAAARFHIKAGDYDFASSRAYYAAFYSMEAVLLRQGLVFSKHSGVMAGFAQHFVSTGIFPKDFSKRIARLFRERQIGDYENLTSAFPPMTQRKTFSTQRLSFKQLSPISKVLNKKINGMFLKRAWLKIET